MLYLQTCVVSLGGRARSTPSWDSRGIRKAEERRARTSDAVENDSQQLRSDWCRCNWPLFTVALWGKVQGEAGMYYYLGWLFRRICMASSVWIFFRSVIDAVDIRRINASIELECPLTANDTVTLGTELSVENGLGQGALATAYRRTLNENCWLEVCIANPSSFADNWIMIH